MRINVRDSERFVDCRAFSELRKPTMHRFQCTIQMTGLLLLLLGSPANAQSPLESQRKIPLEVMPAPTAPTTQRPERPSQFSPEQLKDLMRPSIKLNGRWFGEAGGIKFSDYESKISFPTYPFFGPPPPVLSAGFGFSKVQAPQSLDLPSELYESTLGVAWMRRINERWMIRSMLGVANASDGENVSSDAWQFRGGAFGILEANEQWSWTFGAIALGRNDIPVVPAIGAIYKPSDSLKFNLFFPRPSASLLFKEAHRRQHWAYLGGGLGGGTWAYQNNSGVDDQVTYRDWQLFLGWESTPQPLEGLPVTKGRKIGAEMGYSFGRKFEFELNRNDVDIGDALYFQLSLGFSRLQLAKQICHALLKLQYVCPYLFVDKLRRLQR